MFTVFICFFSDGVRFSKSATLQDLGHKFLIDVDGTVTTAVLTNKKALAASSSFSSQRQHDAAKFKTSNSQFYAYANYIDLV